MKPWEDKLQVKKTPYLLDIINIARRYHLSLKGILIKAALIILSIWIVVDKIEYSLFHIMTQCLRHSDLILISPAIKNLESAGRRSMPPSFIIWECSTFFIFYFFPSDQVISAVLRDQTGRNLLEVWIWRSPSIEEYGNKTSTWTKRGSWSPQGGSKSTRKSH